MEKYTKVIKHLETIEDWETEESFLIDALVLSSAKLFYKSYIELIENSIVTISPWLRQIQENIVVIIGVYEKVYTLEEFVTKEHSPKTIMNRIKTQKYQLKVEEFNQLNNYLMLLKEMLNKFSHTNFEGVMTLFTERFQVPESIAFNKVMMNFFITFLEMPFVVMVNDLYKLELKIPKVIDLKKELKKIGTLQYVTRLFPESIKEFINKSDTLKNYYGKTIKDLQSMSKELAERIKLQE